MNALLHFKTWEPANLPKGVKPTGTAWIFLEKTDGTKKARLVAKGYQVEVFCNIYAPVAQLTTIRMLFSVALQQGWDIIQLDVPTAFLNGELKNDIYMSPAKGVKCKSKVLQLKKSLYGLPSASRDWNEEFDLKMKRYGLIVWVDDINITGGEGEILKLVRYLEQVCNAKNFGTISNFLGTTIELKSNYISISQ